MRTGTPRTPFQLRVAHRNSKSYLNYVSTACVRTYWPGKGEVRRKTNPWPKIRRILTTFLSFNPNTATGAKSNSTLPVHERLRLRLKHNIEQSLHVILVRAAPTKFTKCIGKLTAKINHLLIIHPPECFFYSVEHPAQARKLLASDIKSK